MSNGKWIKVTNWTRWQSYRGDRGQPPWIKLHRCLMRNPEWVSLTDAQRGQLVMIWLLAADRNGEIPSDPSVTRKLSGMDSDPDYTLLSRLGFIEFDAKVTPRRRQRGAKVTSERRQDDANVTLAPMVFLETETETETEQGHVGRADGPPRPDGKAKAWEDWDAYLSADLAQTPGYGMAVWCHYRAGLVDALTAFYSARGGRLTDTRRAYVATQLGRFPVEAQVYAIEFFVDRHAGEKDERYLVGIARRLSRMSPEEQDRELNNHRQRYEGRGLWAGRPQ